MTLLDQEIVKQLTTLCRIDCTAEEQAALLQDLAQMLNYFAQLEEIDTADVPPCHHVIENTGNVMREDVVGARLNRDEFLANAPHIGGMIRVPSIIKSR